MNRQELFEQIKKKKSFLCVGLDSDINKIPKHLMNHEDPVFAFNKEIIDATLPYTIAYKPNIAFYESRGAEGWNSLEKTINYLNEKAPEVFTIADAKRGDIGNTSKMYAQAFFENMEFDAITVAFGVRNFEDLKLGLKEMFRVLKPGGIAAILEFSTPERTPMKQLYSFYFRKILPRVGKFFSNDRSAYTYLPESVSEFPDGDKFLGLLEEIGFSCLSEDVLSFGIASIYTGIKETHNNTKDL